jgi:K+-transporting ATPase KdpF subunit
MPAPPPQTRVHQGVRMIENILLLVLSAALMVYLVYALLRPEKF